MSASKYRVWGICLGLVLCVSSGVQADDFAGRKLQWNTVQHPDNKLPVFGDVLFAQGHYVAGGEGSIKESADGAVWKTVFADPNFVFGPTIYGDGRYVSNGVGVLAVSSDAVTWREVAVPSEDAFFFLAFGDGQYVATGIQCTPSVCASHIFTSTDLQNWTVHDLSAVTQDDFGPVAWNGREFMVLTDDRDGQGKWTFSSPDGLDWTAGGLHAPAGTSFLQLRAVHGHFFALGGWNNESCVQPLLNNFCPSPYLAVTQDGSQWSEVKLSQPFNLFGDIVYVGGQYLATMQYDQGCGVCFLSFKLLASSDGVNWGLAQGVPDDAEPLSVATDGTSAVAVGVHGSIIVAPDARGSGSGAGGPLLLALLAFLLGWRSLARQA